jgi:hypothetical protein
VCRKVSGSGDSSATGVRHENVIDAPLGSSGRTGTLDRRGWREVETSVSVTYRCGDEARVVVDGSLDATAASEIATAWQAVVDDRPRRVDLDLRGVTTFTAPGAAAITDCLSVGRRLDDGVGVRVATDAGRSVLLQSMARL